MKTVHFIFLFAFILGVSAAFLNVEGASGWWFVGVCVGFFGLITYLLDYFNQKKKDGRNN